MTFEVRFSALAKSGATIHRSIEPHANTASIIARSEYLLGRLGYDGNLKSLAIVIEIPDIEALKASREAICRAIGELEAKRFQQEPPIAP